MARSRWLAALSLLLVEPAHAEQETGLTLSWQAPPACPDARAVEAQVTSLLAAPAGGEASLRSIRADGLVTERAGRFRLELELRDGALVDRRQFEGATCEEVAGAAAVAVALLMRPSEEARAAQPSTPAAAAPSAPAGTTRSGERYVPGNNVTKHAIESVVPWEVLETTTRSSRWFDPDARRLAWLFNIHGGLGIGPFSGPNSGVLVGLGVGLEPGLWRFLLSGQLRLETQLLVPEIEGAAAKLAHSSLSLEACRWLVRGPIELAPCLTVSLHVLEASASGSNVTPSPVTTEWLALGPAAVARLPFASLGQVALIGKWGFEVNTARPLLIVDGLGTVEQVGPLEMTLGLGLELIF